MSALLSVGAAALTLLQQAALLPPADTARQPQAASTACSSDFSVPFQVGEKLSYDVFFGPLRAGEGTMEVVAREDVRGLEAWHTRFRVRGSVLFYDVDDVLESWISVNCFHSLRFVQDFDDNGRLRNRRYEIFPERAMYRENDKAEQQSVEDPLDDGSFLYFVRTLELEPGKTYTFNRYFRPDRNPVVIRVLRRERVKVPAGTFNAIVIRPIIKSRGIFSEGGDAQIWLSDDADRIMVQMKTKLKIGSLNLYLKSRPKKETAAR
ncbi:MAG: DUF3108 domain-containing protein [Gemmatimonadaceae bacterium]